MPIRAITAGDVKSIEWVSKTHAALIPDSPLSRFGVPFMQDFYYPKLISAGLIHCDVFEKDGRLAAFASYTESPYTFMGEGLKKFFLPALAALAKSFITKPASLGLMVSMLKRSRQRGGVSQASGEGELLTFAVLPEFSGVVEASANKKISCMLFEHVLKFFKEKRFTSVQMMIRKKNTASLLFFKSYGAVPVDASFVDHDTYLMKISTGAQ